MTEENSKSSSIIWPIIRNHIFNSDKLQFMARFSKSVASEGINLHGGSSKSSFTKAGKATVVSVR